MPPRIIDRDRGMKRIRATLRRIELQRKVVVVGFLEDGKGGEQHEADGLTVAQIAAIHEYGATVTTASGATIVIPARSMLRATFDEQREANVKKLRTLADAVLMGRIPLERALNVFGVDMVGQVVTRINVGIPPPNAESTIRRKGSDKPLVDSGQMKQSVQHAVKDA